MPFGVYIVSCPWCQYFESRFAESGVTGLESVYFAKLQKSKNVLF
jgi:hypothetical protein